MLPINEFDFDGICALLFPTLFPFGMGDPTKKSRLKEVTEALGFKHLIKYACKNSKQELYYPLNTRGLNFGPMIEEDAIQA